MKKSRKPYYTFLFSALLLLFFLPLAAQEGYGPYSSGLLKPYYSLSADTTQISLLIKKSRTVGKDSALQLAREALNRSYRCGYDEGVGRALYVSSCVLLDQRKFKEAKKLLFTALPFALPVTNKYLNLLPNIYTLLGNTYTHNGRMDSAFYYYNKALQECGKRKIPFYSSLVMCIYANMGEALPQMGQAQLSFYYLDKGMKIAQHLRDTAMIIQILGGKGQAFHILSQHDSTFYYLQQSLYLSQKSKKTGASNAYYIMGRDWLLQDSFLKARAYFDSAILANDVDMEHCGPIWQAIGGTEVLAGHYTAALQHYQKALTIAENEDEVESKTYIYPALAIIYAKKGKGLLAYQYQKAYSDLKDSLLQKDKTTTIHEIEVKFRVSEKDRLLVANQLSIARQKNKIQQQYMGIGLALLCIFVLLVLMRRKKHKNLVDKLRASLAGEEKERLRMASELHDGIVSKLSSVKMNLSLLETSIPPDSEESKELVQVRKQLDASISELRTTAQNLQPSVLQKAGLIKALEYYCLQINKVYPITLTFQLTGNMPPLQDDFQLHIYRIVQELIQNMLKHSCATTAWIQFHARPEKLLVTVEDNGVGIGDESGKVEQGIGFVNLRSRVQYLNGTLSLANSNGTVIQLEFNLKNFRTT